MKSTILRNNILNKLIRTNSTSSSTQCILRRSFSVDGFEGRNVERFGPILPTAKSQSEESGGTRKTWRDEQAPASAVSPAVAFPG